MGRKEENTHFNCVECGRSVLPLQNGSYRNHCPFCLSSLHLDDVTPGDRKSTCGGVMRACRLIKSKKGWQLVHKCTKCHVEKVNKIAEGDAQSDDFAEIVRLSCPF